MVSDNYSADHTQQIVRSHASSKVVYVRTQRRLSMPDNWEFALHRARGEYITYLTDDSYLLPSSLAIAMAELERFKVKVAVWRHCAYFAPDWNEPARRNIVYIPRVTNNSYLLTADDALQKLYRRLDGNSVPKCLNSLCHRSIIERVMGAKKRFFLPSCPDYSSAASILLNIPEYVFVDQCLYLDGVTPSSIGATSGFDLGPSTQEYLKEFKEKEEDVVHLGIPTSPSGIAASLEAVRKLYPETCPKVNRKNLLCGVADRLIKVEGNGGDVGGYWPKFNQHLASQPLNIKWAVGRQKILSTLKWMLVRAIRQSPRLECLERARGFRILRGSEWNFTNIEECAEVLARMKQSASSARASRNAVLRAI